MKNAIVCNRCGSDNIQYGIVSEHERRGCFATLLWLTLAVFTLGLSILIPLLLGKSSKTRSYAVCQNCGHKWRV